MFTIYKYPIPFSEMREDRRDTFNLDLPVGARILHVDYQHGNPFIWAMVEPSKFLESRSFFIAGTGQSLGDRAPFMVWTHISTFLSPDEDFVWHIFEIG